VSSNCPGGVCSPTSWPAAHRRSASFRVGAAEDVRTVKDAAGVDLLVAPRRYILDEILADAAVRAGADVRFGVTATGLRREPGGRAGGIHARDDSGEPVELSARFVVGADGMRSRLARAVAAHHQESRMTVISQSPVRNGVDTATLFATLDAVKGQPEIAKFQFRATNRWINGTHNRGTINGYYGAEQEMSRAQDFTFDADHPPVLVGGDNGPTPVEYVLHALAACLTAGLANIAAARGIQLTEV
jgi:FAD binding domain/OsmC-like protein